MANIKSAKKRVLQNEKRRQVNAARKSAIKTATKAVLDAISKGEEVTAVKSLLRDAEAQIARAKGKKVLHRNTASRKVSRLAKRVAAFARTGATAQK
jgi:small subunit ribosomal protein S20